MRAPLVGARPTIVGDALTTVCLILSWTGPLLGCASGIGDPAGNTLISVIVPVQQPAFQSIDYTATCPPREVGGSPDMDELRFEGIVERLSDDEAATITEMARVWRARLDLPVGAACGIALRGRDENGEVTCTSAETFNTREDGETRINLLLTCIMGGDVFPTQTEQVNTCPTLADPRCSDFDDTGSIWCEVHFRDDNTCGTACDPQTCFPTRRGLVCIPGPDPGASTTVSCSEGLLDCDLDGSVDASCVFTKTEQSFSVGCAGTDDEPTAQRIVCEVRTSDGDVDCDEVREVDLVCPE